jgi:putative MATE family efflux protein
MNSVKPEADSSRSHGVLALALPALGEQMLNFSVSLYDTFLAGRISGGAHEVGVYTTTVGIASYLSWLATLLFSLVGTGTTALVARARGANDFEQANRLANRSIVLAGPLAVVICLLLTWVAPLVARGARLEGESARILINFVRLDALGQLFFGFCVVGAAALRGAKDMRTPMWILGCVNLVNIAVSSVLVFGRQTVHFWGLDRPVTIGLVDSWGVNGIVTATVTARVLGGLLMLLMLWRGASGLKLTRRFLWPAAEDTLRILRVGVPAACEGTCMWYGQWLFLQIIAHLGTEADGSAYKAAHMIGMDVEALTYLPATAWGYAAATLVGQNLGAGRPDLARRAVHEAARHCIGVAIFGALVYLLGADLIYSVMTREESVRVIGTPALRFLSWYQVPLAVLIVYLHAIRGSGATPNVLAINAAGFFLIRLPLAWFLGIKLQLGLIGAWSGMCVDVVARATIAGIYFARGRWASTVI